MKNKSTLLFYTSIITFIIFLISISKVVAQENGIFELGSNQTAWKQSSEKAKSQNYKKEFYGLAFNLHPTHYIENNKLKTVYGSGDPIKLTFKDFKSFDWLNNKNSKKDYIELLTVYLNNVNDLRNLIDISSDKGFKKLKYIFIKCNFNCSENEIEQFIKANSKVRIFYSNVIGG